MGWRGGRPCFKPFLEDTYFLRLVKVIIRIIQAFFLMFFLSLGFIYLFFFFSLLNFYPVTSFPVTQLLVTRYSLLVTALLCLVTPIRNLVNPLSRVEIFESAIYPETCGH